VDKVDPVLEEAWLVLVEVVDAEAAVNDFDVAAVDVLATTVGVDVFAVNVGVDVVVVVVVVGVAVDVDVDAYADIVVLFMWTLT
jgi:hypothetical protein